jgi:hypothetical protein
MMRITTSVLLALAYLLLHIQRRLPMASGLASILWGMTKQQVERAYPNYEEYDRVFVGGPETVFGLRTYGAASCDFEVWFNF